MAKTNPKTVCRTPTPGKQPTRIDQWKFDRIRQLILEVIGSRRGGVEFRMLPSMVDKRLKNVEREKIGSIRWYVTVVKLELEVRGEIQRTRDSNPQRLVRR